MSKLVISGAAPLRLAAALSLAVMAGLPFQAPAQAQAVLALVNTRPVTNFDVEQRIRLSAALERRRLDRKSALEELINDQAKLLEARRVGYRVTEEGVEAEFSKLAKNNRQDERTFGDNLKRAGIEPSALKDKIRADLAWSALIRDQQRRAGQVSNTEIESAVNEKRKKDGLITEYSLRQVIFIVPPGASPASRIAAANAARAKFTSCETGFDELRQLPDVAVRPAIFRSSEDIGKALRDLLDKTPVDRMTPASASSEGVEIVAVCGKSTRESTTTTRSAVAAELTEKKINDNAKTYLKEIRSRLEIKYR